MKIAGIYPQDNELDPKIQHAVGEPYGLEMILAIAKQEGHEVNLFMPTKIENNKFKNLNEDEFIDSIINFKPDVAAFSLYTSQYPLGKKIAQKLKEINPNITTIAGNRYPTFLKNAQKPFDFFVLKEGEETFREFLKEKQNGQRYEQIRGLSSSINPQASINLRERNFNLDSLPNALRFPIILEQVYKGVSLPSLSKNPHYAVMEYSRCCHNNCKFCDNEGFWGNKVAFRSTSRVIDEMFELKEKGVDIFYFMDLNFTSQLNKTKELCDEMIKRKLNVSWYCMSNVSTVDNLEGNEILSNMKKAGCFKIAWGVESTSDNALQKMNKKVGKNFTTNEQTIRVLEKSLNAGIINQGFYIIGFPWENEKSIISDAENLKYMPIHLLNIGIFTPIPLSRFYKEMNDEGYIFNSDLEKHDRNQLVYNHKTLTNKTIKQLQKSIYDNFQKTPEHYARIVKTCLLDPRFKESFNDYFEFSKSEVRV
jgi:radical SAM superfamily enzyme YgiQ (UPF0313 family)